MTSTAQTPAGNRGKREIGSASTQSIVLFGQEYMNHRLSRKNGIFRLTLQPFDIFQKFWWAYKPLSSGPSCRHHTFHLHCLCLNMGSNRLQPSWYASRFCDVEKLTNYMLRFSTPHQTGPSAGRILIYDLWLTRKRSHLYTSKVVA